MPINRNVAILTTPPMPVKENFVDVQTAGGLFVNERKT